MRRKKRRLAIGRILQVSLALAALVVGVVLVAGSIGLPQLGGRPANLSYEQFEKDLKDRRVASATMDGNIIAASYRDGSVARVLTPSPDRSVELMLKFEVNVEAARPVPASGVNLPVLGIILIPYAILGYFAIGMVRAAEGSIEIDVASWDAGEDSDLPTATPEEPTSEPGPRPDRPLSAADQ